MTYFHSFIRLTIFTIVLTSSLPACQNQAIVMTPDLVPEEALNDTAPSSVNAPPPLSSPTSSVVAESNSSDNGPTANNLLAAVGQTMLATNSLRWEARIKGQFNGVNSQQTINETITVCALVLPNENYCVTNELVDATGTVSEIPVELLQIGTDQYGRQGDASWRPITGQDRPNSIILHELFRVQNGRLLFFANEYIIASNIIGQETIDGVNATIVSVEFDTVVYDLYATWYGNDVTIPTNSQRLTSKLWISPAGQLLQSESQLETTVDEGMLLLTLETSYGSFNEPQEIPQP